MNLAKSLLFAALSSALLTGFAAAREGDGSRYASEAEGKLRDQLQNHVAELAKFKLSETDRAETLAALALVAGGKIEEARVATDKLKAATARTLATWLRLLRAQDEATTYRAFLDENRNWPLAHTIQRHFERALLSEGTDGKQVIRYLADHEPLSGAGMAALAVAELAAKNETKAHKLAADAWCFKRFSSDVEALILARLGKMLTAADHKCRLDRLLISDPRGRWIRRSRANAAGRLVALLDKPDQVKARARIKAYLGQRALKDLTRIVKSPALVKGDWGLAYQRIVRSRKRRDYEHALKILKTVPGDAKDMVNRDSWWVERQRHARHWIEKRNYKRAYGLIAGVRPESANPAKDQAFLAGWLALMKLGKAKEALEHFERMVAHADGPLSKSMSEFWLAEAHTKAGAKAKAKEHYRKSSEIKDTFHALLSKRKVEPKSRTIALPAARLPTPQEVERFKANGVVKGLLLAIDLELPRRRVLSFYRALGHKLESAGELALMAQLASTIGDGQGEVRLGKYAIARGFNLYEFAYPVHHLPTYKPLRDPIEPAMLLAIARQESEFNTQIVSRAGARGVLQVMPITARHVCREHKIKCNMAGLLAKPAYNTRIASAYIADRHDEFRRSYILTLTGFNAGPGRTRQWLRQMGDPRSPKVKPLDWIYRIPFRETRLYVRKVLSNLQIYRARRGEGEPLRIDKDLMRGRRG